VCTVTYLPLGQDNFILTSNRDEIPSRQPSELFHDEENFLIYPKEPKHGGTWICISSTSKVICLLNGAFENHTKEKDYRKSRGIVLLEIIKSNINFKDFIHQYDLMGIEPFTLIVLEKNILYDFKWDSNQKHLFELDKNKAYIWSSSTLYNEDTKQLRQSWFDQWLTDNSEYSPESILKFHKSAGVGNPEIDLIMSRVNSKTCTISITQVIKSEHNISLIYEDRILSNTKNATLKIK
jgi:uncharacterized protein with NRDE domain